MPQQTTTPQPIAMPLIFDGMAWPELAAWHRLARIDGDGVRCRLIERAVNDLPMCDKRLIGMLKYYIPTNNCEPINITTNGI